MPFLGWGKTSLQHLSSLEDRIFSCLTRKPTGQYVSLDEDPNRQMWTITMNTENNNFKALPLVLLHGMGAGVGLWVLNLEQLSSSRTLYALDLPGFGKSFRTKPCSKLTAEVAENEFVNSIESWRKSMNLTEFVLLGHSLGGYLASAYALKYPEHVKGLILVDSWGFPPKLLKKERSELPLSARAALFLYQAFNPNPLSLLRAAGPWGPSLVKKIRPDLIRKFKHENMEDDTTIADYVYHCNAREPSGEAAFKSMVDGLGWAKNPMVNRIEDLKLDIPITMIHGENSWVDHSVCHDVKLARLKSVVNIKVLKDAGHHVYADQADTFNEFVKEVCLSYDKDVKQKIIEIKVSNDEDPLCEAMMEHVM